MAEEGKLTMEYLSQIGLAYSLDKFLNPGYSLIPFHGLKTNVAVTLY